MKTQQDRYAVFGNPIKHSKSPIIQLAFAQQTQQSIVYTAEYIEKSEFRKATTLFFQSLGKGLNITVPFKLEAFEYADTLTPRAQKAQAVNTLIKKGNQIIGDNTDGIGLITDITKNQQWTIKNKRILILGAGGAVRGILEPLLNEQPAHVVITNRTLEKAEQLANAFSIDGSISACSYNDLIQEQSFDIIINGTSASLQGELPELPTQLLDSSCHCYDMMYDKEPTVFMQWAIKNGAQAASDGLGMLVCQGAESFFQWRGIRPETQVVINKVRALL